MAETVTIDEQIAEVEREIRLREVVYPRWVAAPKPKLSQAQADKQIGRMRAVLITLVALKELKYELGPTMPVLKHGD